MRRGRESNRRRSTRFNNSNEATETKKKKKEKGRAVEKRDSRYSRATVLCRALISLDVSQRVANIDLHVDSFQCLLRQVLLFSLHAEMFYFFFFFFFFGPRPSCRQNLGATATRGRGSGGRRKSLAETTARADARHIVRNLQPPRLSTSAIWSIRRRNYRTTHAQFPRTITAISVLIFRGQLAFPDNRISRRHAARYIEGERGTYLKNSGDTLPIC